MRKNVCLMLLICLFTLLIQPSSTSGKHKADEPLLTDTLITLLNPAISEAVENYYGYLKSYGLYDAKILDISRETEGGFTFKAKVQINTYEAAHNPPYGTETIVLGVEPDKVKVLAFLHKGDAYEEKIKEFYDKSLSDIQKTFQLNLSHFEKLTDDQLQFKAENKAEYNTLANIVTSIIEKEINPEIKTPDTPFKNVITPVTFIKGNTGYILYKKADGTNFVVEVKNSDGRWIVVNKRSTRGKRMKNELLWYM